MTDEEKPPPEESSAFKDLLEKLVKVPKREIDEKEREYRNGREEARKRQKAV